MTAIRLASDTSLRKLLVSIRTRACLDLAGLKTWGDVEAMTVAQLLAFPNFSLLVLADLTSAAAELARERAQQARQGSR